MDPGQLDQRITLASRQVVKDEYGQAAITWINASTVYARVEALRGREYFAAAQVQQEHSLKVWIRRRDDVDATWRLTWRGEHYDITSAVRLGPDMTEILCVKGVKDGR